ncbi:MAG: phosphoesterase RecJ domain-containing protein [Parcubacteria group bacterium LiPW_39]|nr:MAG: phosphoesterase RecJ domain-containing protein [Parcubacteria group bacterium LiPW_39]
MLSPLQQAVDLLQKSKNILIALPENISGDALGCALALEKTLQKLNKKVEVAAQEPVPEKLKFLPARELKDKLAVWRDFIISIDTSQNKISRLRYEKESGILKIFLTTPDKIEEKHIKLEPGAFYYDLIIVLDAPDLESLGRIFENNSELFFNQSILNIDHKAANEYFGEVNLVEPTAAACAEIVAGLIANLGPNLIDEAGATALLTGLIEKTRSFQNVKTTPQALNLASSLMTKGAEQEKIIRCLYKTKPLNLLRLWGQLLSRFEYDQERKIVWFLAKAEDFKTSQTSTKDLPLILEEINDLFPQLNLSLVLWPDETGCLWLLAQAKQPEILQKINLEMPGAIKNGKLLIRTNATDLNSVKNCLSNLLNSFT